MAPLYSLLLQSPQRPPRTRPSPRQARGLLVQILPLPILPAHTSDQHDQPQAYPSLSFFLPFFLSLSLFGQTRSQSQPGVSAYSLLLLYFYSTSTLLYSILFCSVPPYPSSSSTIPYNLLSSNQAPHSLCFLILTLTLTLILTLILTLTLILLSSVEVSSHIHPSCINIYLCPSFFLTLTLTLMIWLVLLSSLCLFDFISLSHFHQSCIHLVDLIVYRYIISYILYTIYHISYTIFLIIIKNKNSYYS